jgi:hypothetical protein
MAADGNSRGPEPRDAYGYDRQKDDSDVTWNESWNQIRQEREVQSEEDRFVGRASERELRNQTEANSAVAAPSTRSLVQLDREDEVDEVASGLSDKSENRNYREVYMNRPTS